jgi:hypothetical protein
MNHDHHLLWELSSAAGGGASGITTSCIMVSCCSGAELQVVRSTADGEEQIILRELYPDRDSLYERARELRVEMAQDSGLKAQGEPELPVSPEP